MAAFNSVTWTVVGLTTAKFEPIIFSVLGFALSYIENMWIIMILYNLCLLLALFYDKIINIRNFESHMQIADRYAPWKIASGTENFFCRCFEARLNNNSLVRTSKRTPHFTVIKIKWLMLFKEITAWNQVLWCMHYRCLLLWMYECWCIYKGVFKLTFSERFDANARRCWRNVCLTISGFLRRYVTTF
jgi:hypothetical protein